MIKIISIVKGIDKCDECDNKLLLIEFDNKSGISYICRECLIKAIKLFPVKFVEAHPSTECILRGCDK